MCIIVHEGSINMAYSGKKYFPIITVTPTLMHKICTSKNKQTNNPTNQQTNTQTNKQRNKQRNKHTNKITNKQNKTKKLYLLDGLFVWFWCLFCVLFVCLFECFLIQINCELSFIVWLLPPTFVLTIFVIATAKKKNDLVLLSPSRATIRNILNSSVQCAHVCGAQNGGFQDYCFLGNIYIGHLGVIVAVIITFLHIRISNICSCTIKLWSASYKSKYQDTKNVTKLHKIVNSCSTLARALSCFYHSFCVCYLIFQLQLNFTLYWNPQYGGSMIPLVLIDCIMIYMQLQ